MVDREQAGDIDAAASEWVARALRGLSGPEQLTLDRWLEDDPRRLGAYVRAQAVWIHAERAKVLGSPTGLAKAAPLNPTNPIGITKRRPTRRILIAGGGALAASVSGGLFVLEQPRAIDSGVGEIRRLTLADGSTLSLDTDTHVRVARGSDDRVLELVRGKLFMTVVSASRPVTLSVGRIAMRIAEGAFGLESIGRHPLEAIVTQGRLAVSQNGLWGQTHAITLAADTTLSLPVSANFDMAVVRTIGPAALDQLLAWRDGMLSFADEPLMAAVRQFDRYGPLRIEITDPHLAKQKITGLFQANDPKGFATAVAASFGATVASDGDVLRIFIKK